MNVTFIPTLAVLRELYEQPRSIDRFWNYIDTMIGTNAAGKQDVILPITAANPMGKDNCLAAVNALIAIDAEGVAARAAEAAAARLTECDQQVKAYVTLIDDVGGMWSQKETLEFDGRYGSDFLLRANSSRHLAGVGCYTSETYSAGQIHTNMLAALQRYAVFSTRGRPKTLRAMLAFDRETARFCGATEPALDPEDLEYTRAVLAPLLDRDDYPTCFAAMMGDAAAISQGYPPLGLSPRAGQALAVQS